VLGYLWRGRLPYLVALRGSDVPGYNPRLRWLDPLAFRPLSRVVWRSATVITCVSQSLAALAERTDPRIVPQVIGNGVDSAQFQPGEKPAQFTILYVGRLIPRKGVEFLIRAVADLHDAGGDCRLVLAGGGPERPTLERFCRQRGIASRVEFRGDVRHDELPALYARSSLFVMPAVREAMSNAVLEAMASGLPVIMTRAGGSHCIDGNGLIVDSQDSKQLEAAIARYMNDADLVRRHGERSRELAERLTWPDVACAYLDLYRRTARVRDESSASRSAVVNARH
jgi:glycosyltransferase involved in cell wall biosynthesis